MRKSMVTPVQRRQWVLSVDEARISNPAARTLVKAAKAVMEENLNKMAMFLKCRDQEPERQPAFSIIALIKPVGDRCNLRCRYCFNKPWVRSRVMPDEILEAIIAQVLELSGGTVRFIFHGGEPLLSGIEFFKKAVMFQDRYRRPDQFIRNAVTTNGTLLDEEWGIFFEASIRCHGGVDGPRPSMMQTVWMHRVAGRWNGDERGSVCPGLRRKVGSFRSSPAHPPFPPGNCSNS
jgi:hypothetical protein